VSDQERLARALGRDPESMHDDEQVRENQWVCKRCGRAIVAVPSYTWRRADYGPCTPEPLDIDWSIVPTVLADIEKRGWQVSLTLEPDSTWTVFIFKQEMLMEDGRVEFDANRLSLSNAANLPFALSQAYVEAVEGSK